MRMINIIYEIGNKEDLKPFTHTYRYDIKDKIHQKPIMIIWTRIQGNADHNIKEYLISKLINPLLLILKQDKSSNRTKYRAISQKDI